MRYRKLDQDDDYSFGASSVNFLVDSPELVAQSILTRLRLVTGEWFLDVTEGTPYPTQILGANTQKTRDTAIRTRINETPGVVGILSYSSVLQGRDFRVTARVSTIFGQVSLDVAL